MGCLYQIRWSKGPNNNDFPYTAEPQRMAGDQITQGDAVTAGITSVAELSSVLWETCRPAWQCTQGVGVLPGSCFSASGNMPASGPQS